MANLKLSKGDGRLTNELIYKVCAQSDGFIVISAGLDELEVVLDKGDFVVIVDVERRPQNEEHRLHFFAAVTRQRMRFSRRLENVRTFRRARDIASCL